MLNYVQPKEYICILLSKYKRNANPEKKWEAWLSYTYKINTLILMRDWVRCYNQIKGQSQEQTHG